MNQICKTLRSVLAVRSLQGTRLLLALVAMVSLGYSAQAQTTISKTDKDALLAQRNQLVASGTSTRQVDARLLAYDVKFPAKVTITETASDKTVSFTSTKEFTETNASVYASRLQKEYPAIKAVAIDYRTGICMVTFGKTATDTEISQVVNRFGFDGFNLVK